VWGQKNPKMFIKKEQTTKEGGTIYCLETSEGLGPQTSAGERFQEATTDRA